MVRSQGSPVIPCTRGAPPGGKRRRGGRSESNGSFLFHFSLFFPPLISSNFLNTIIELMLRPYLSLSPIFAFFFALFFLTKRTNFMWSDDSLLSNLPRTRCGIASFHKMLLLSSFWFFWNNPVKCVDCKQVVIQWRIPLARMCLCSTNRKRRRNQSKPSCFPSIQMPVKISKLLLCT